MILLGPLSDLCYRQTGPQFSVILGGLMAVAGGLGGYFASDVTILTFSYAIIGT